MCGKFPIKKRAKPSAAGSDPSAERKFRAVREYGFLEPELKIYIFCKNFDTPAVEDFAPAGVSFDSASAVEVEHSAKGRSTDRTMKKSSHRVRNRRRRQEQDGLLPQMTGQCADMAGCQET